MLAFAFMLKTICNVFLIVTENIWKKQNVKMLPFDAYLVFTKILEANLCFGTNFPWGTNCQIKQDSHRCSSTKMNSDVSWYKSSFLFHLLSWVFECMKSILEAGGQALCSVLRKILVWVIESQEDFLIKHVSHLPKGTIRVLWMHLSCTTTARGSGETMLTPRVHAASLYSYFSQ